MAPQQHKRKIDLFLGWPNSSLLPISQIENATQLVLSQPDDATAGLLYDNGYLGYQKLREQLARFLITFYMQQTSPISPERLCITGGASQNLACILQVYSDPVYTRNVWMVAPTYFLACRIFEDHGFKRKLKAVEESVDGCDVDFLERQLKIDQDDQRNEEFSRPDLKVRSTLVRFSLTTHYTEARCTLVLAHERRSLRPQAVPPHYLRCSNIFQSFITDHAPCL